jgi:hypothetical protein
MRIMTEVTSAPLVDKTTMEDSMFHSLPSLSSKESFTEPRKHLVDADMVKFVLKPPSRRSSIATTYQGEVRIIAYAYLFSPRPFLIFLEQPRHETTRNKTLIKEYSEMSFDHLGAFLLLCVLCSSSVPWFALLALVPLDCRPLGCVLLGCALLTFVDLGSFYIPYPSFFSTSEFSCSEFCASG